MFCSKFKQALESIDHLLTRCIYACEVWSEMQTLTGVRDGWQGISLEEFLKIGF
jgi:hypothetical protein